MPPPLSGELVAGTGIIAGGLLIVALILGLDIPFAPWLLIACALLVVGGAAAMLLAAEGG